MNDNWFHFLISKSYKNISLSLINWEKLIKIFYIICFFCIFFIVRARTLIHFSKNIKTCLRKHSSTKWLLWYEFLLLDFFISFVIINGIYQNSFYYIIISIIIPLTAFVLMQETYSKSFSKIHVIWMIILIYCHVATLFLFFNPMLIFSYSKLISYKKSDLISVGNNHYTIPCKKS